MSLVIRTFMNEEEESHLVMRVRFGLISGQISQFFDAGSAAADVDTGLNASLLLFLYCFNDLRDIFVASFKASDMEMTKHNMTCRISSMKGKKEN